MQTGRFGLLPIGRANVATRAGAEWPGLVVSGQAAFGRRLAIADIARSCRISQKGSGIVKERHTANSCH